MVRPSNVNRAVFPRGETCLDLDDLETAGGNPYVVARVEDGQP